MMDIAIEPTTHVSVAHMIRHLSARADNPAARAWNSIIRDAAYAGATGTVKTWLTERRGTELHTLQASVHESGDVYGIWTPGRRTVDTSRATYATFATEDSSSRRDYAGLKVVAATGDTLIVVSPWGDDVIQVIVYTTRG